jgi:hypothetical protein
MLAGLMSAPLIAWTFPGWLGGVALVKSHRFSLCGDLSDWVLGTECRGLRARGRSSRGAGEKGKVEVGRPFCTRAAKWRLIHPWRLAGRARNHLAGDRNLSFITANYKEKLPRQDSSCLFLWTWGNYFSSKLLPVFQVFNSSAVLGTCCFRWKWILLSFSVGCHGVVSVCSPI